MTYYEELGLAPAASPDQIRHSYKTLAKLLHPDQYPDDHLKRMAELQMRRLNEIFSVLTDPEKRWQYDTQLQAPPVLRPYATAVPMPLPRRYRPLHRWMIGLCAWGLPLVTLVIFLSVLLSESAAVRPVLTPLSPADPTPHVTSTPPPSTPAKARNTGRVRTPGDGFDRSQLLARLRESQAELEALRAEHQRTLEELALTVRPALSDETLPAPARLAARPVAESRLATPSAHRERGFGGNWYYVPTAHETSNGMYVPEYIELHVSEGAGIVRGRYQARYRVTDQAIGPEVAFRFEGHASPPDTQLSWTGPGDAQGKVTLRLISADRLEVSWSASQLSAELNLASGSAQLIRQREP